MKFLIYYFLFLFFLLSIFISGVVDSQDSLQYLAVARNIYYKGKPTAPMDEFKSKKNIRMSTYVGKDGNTYSATGLGYSLVLVPAVALTDIFYKYYNITPVERFPLENDWLILLTASFINAFFGALMGVVLYVYLRKLKISHNQALFLSLAGIFGTNLFAYSKHTWVHMMFSVFLLIAFLMIRLFFEYKQKRYLILSGISFGITLISYNMTFILTIIPLGIFYLMLTKFKFDLSKIRTDFKFFFWFVVGFLPFLFVFVGFENLRATKDVTVASPSFLASYANSRIISTPISVLYESIFGQLFSVGRSFFLYSPILLIIVFFWHKIKRQIFPELISFFLLAGIYILFYSIQYSYGDPTRGFITLWHGESSWGPRYLVPIIPIGVLVIGFIYTKLQKKAKLFVFFPLLVFGIYIQLLGIIMPYQIKYHDLEKEFIVNSSQFVNYTYQNWIPRFSPIFMMSKKLVKNLIAYPKTLDHGEYNVKYYDGIDFPFNVGKERWRTIEKKGYISFDNSKKDPVKKLSFGLINHPIGKESSGSAKLRFNLNGHPLLQDFAVVELAERKQIDIPIKNDIIRPKTNILTVEVNYIDKTPVKKRSQITGLKSLLINNKPVNLESLDFPYYSPLGPAMVNAKYNTYGGKITDPWRFWDLHTQLYERTPDFWWMRTWYYWDYPKKVLNIIFITVLFSMIFFGYKIFSK